MVQEEKYNSFYKDEQPKKVHSSIIRNNIVPLQLQAARLATQ